MGKRPPKRSDRDAMTAGLDKAWREPAQIASQWQDSTRFDPRLLKYRATKGWWETLERCGVTLIATREYEHLVMALGVVDGKPSVTYMSMPHPSGIAVDRKASVVHIASTRNPNQVFDLAPVTGAMDRNDAHSGNALGAPLVPIRSRFLPGSLYLHDLAMIDGGLHASAAGQNAIVRIDPSGQHKRVWWPRCIERKGKPVHQLNHIQLNSIAAGKRIADSFFSASSESISSRRPGHKNYPVDGRGVIFSGKTREPIVRGLTRPHSARLYRKKLWVNNSGYGELCVARGERAECVTRLSSWTRGLCFAKDVAFVGTSRVIPRFRQYAPGLEVESSECGIYAIDITSGRVLGSLKWPYGNQTFAVEHVSSTFCTGFPFSQRQRPNQARVKDLFYSFVTQY